MPQRRPGTIERNSRRKPSGRPATARGAESGRESGREAGEVAGYPHGRVPRALRMQQVLAAAEALFVERGYAQASMDELARRVGVSKPVIYDLVASKEQLFGALVAAEAQALAAEVEGAVTNDTDPTTRLYAGALAFFRFAERRRAAWNALYTAEGAPVSVELTQVRRFHARSIAALLARGAQDLGKPVDAVLLDASAQAINGAFEALAEWWKAHPHVSAETLAELATALVARGLLGLIELSPQPVLGPPR
jgi:AcrR family transcriptional regulator